MHNAVLRTITTIAALVALSNEMRSFGSHSGRIKNVIENKSTVIDDNQEFKQVLFYVEFENMKIFDQEINIKDHMDNLVDLNYHLAHFLQQQLHLD